MSLHDYAIVASTIAAMGLLMAAGLAIRTAIAWLVAWEAVRFFIRYEMAKCAIGVKVREGHR